MYLIGLFSCHVVVGAFCSQSICTLLWPMQCRRHHTCPLTSIASSVLLNETLKICIRNPIEPLCLLSFYCNDKELYLLQGAAQVNFQRSFHLSNPNYNAVHSNSYMKTRNSNASWCSCLLSLNASSARLVHLNASARWGQHNHTYRHLSPFRVCSERPTREMYRS